MLSSLLTDYTFWVVGIGTMLLGLTSGVVGTTLVLEKQSQLGDAIGHAVYPGVILAFILFQKRELSILITGAIICGLCVYALIYWITSKTDLFAFETILALILSTFFGLGMVLLSYIQGNPQYQNASQAGLSTFIMGQAAYLMKQDVYFITILSIVILIIFIVLYPQIKLTLFDKNFAKSIGINTLYIQRTTLLLCLAVICLGLKAVGIILISSMLIAPAITAQQWSRDYRTMVVISGVVGLVSAFIGTVMSSIIPNLATGPTIVVVLSIFAFVSLLFGSNHRKRGEHHA